MTLETALVTGASAGIGLEIARCLTPFCEHLIVVARRRDRLEALALELASSQTRVHVIAMDLGVPGSAQRLYDEVKALGLSPSVLVNNAAIARHQRFLTDELAWLQRILCLNVNCLAELTLLYARDMATAGYGRILQVASMGAYQPTPYNAAYCATKAFVGSLGEALNWELRGTGVSVTTIYPWKTATEIHHSSGSKDPELYKTLALDPRDVASIAVRELLAGSDSVAIGIQSKVARLLTRWVPRTWVRELAGRAMRESLAC